MTLDSLQRVGFKVFLKEGARIDPRDVVPVFHRWIQARAIDQLLIDVADYAHLHDGPRVVLVAHEGNFALDDTGGRPGLQYYRKQPLDGPLSSRLASLCGILLQAAILLGDDLALEGGDRFRGDELELVANDRLLAPNSDEAFAGLRAALAPVAARLYPDTTCTFARHPDPQERLTITLKVAAPAALETLAGRLGAPRR